MKDKDKCKHETTHTSTIRHESGPRLVKYVCNDCGKKVDEKYYD